MNHINTGFPNISSSGTSSLASKNEEAYQALDSAYQISSYLKCNIDKNTLAIMISMVESGCKPEHIAAIVAEIKSRASMNNSF